MLTGTMLTGSGAKQGKARSPQASMQADDSPEKVVWETLPGGIRLNVWNSDRCWKALQTQYAFCIVHRGIAEWQYRGQTFNVAAGGVYPLEPGEVHTTRKVHQTGDFSVFFLDTQWVSAAACELVNTEVPHFEAAGVPSVELWRVAARAASLDLKTETDAVSQELSRCLSGTLVQTSARKRARVSSHTVSRARQMMYEQFHINPMQTVNIGAVAKEVGLGYHTLVHEFSRRYGAPPYEYVDLLRAQYVIGRLRSGPSDEVSSLAALSRAVGFSDAAHLSRNFRKHYFCSPSFAARQLNDAWRRSVSPRQVSARLR